MQPPCFVCFGYPEEALKAQVGAIDIDDPILKDLKRLQRREGKSLGRLISDLLAMALATQQRGSQPAAPAFKWIARPMHARVDLADKHALPDAMDDIGR